MNAQAARFAVGALLLAACAALTAARPGAANERPVEVLDAWVAATPPGVENAAAYATLVSRDRTDRLVSASSPAARAVELHESRAANGVVTMRRVAALELPAGRPVALEPGALHLMLLGIARAFAPGQTVRLTLVLENAGPIEVDAPVRDARELATERRSEPEPHAH